ncbi:MAG: hypothetical protein V4548_10680 [Bacteroidota bacterium]
MKKIFLSICFLFCIYVNAQTVIAEEKYGVKTQNPFFYSFVNSNKFFINKGSDKYVFINSTVNDTIVTKSSTLLNKLERLATVSNTERTFKSYDSSGKASYYDANGKVIGTGFYTDFKEEKKCFYGENFTDLFELGITNEDKNAEIKLEKNALYLETIDFTKRKNKRIKLEALDISRLSGEKLNKPHEKIGFKCLLNKDNSFDIITKSISKDYTSTILYRTTYNLLGKKINDVPFKLELNNKYFLYSNNEGGDIGHTTRMVYATSGTGQKGEGVFTDDLSINNFIEDNETGDVYIYGLYGDKAYKLNNLAKPKGYYVFKFDKKGNKIWESINELEKDKYDFFSTIFHTRLIKMNDKYCFYFIHDRRLNYGLVDGKSGKLLKNNVLTFFGGRMGSSLKYFEHYDVKEIKNKTFGINGLIAMDYSTKFKSYINSLDPKMDIHFNSWFSNKGIYVLEFYKKTNYKILFFEY